MAVPARPRRASRRFRAAPASLRAGRTLLPIAVALLLAVLSGCAPHYPDHSALRALAPVVLPYDEAARAHFGFRDPPPVLRPSARRAATATVIRSLRASTFVPAPPRRVDCLKVKCVALTFDDGPVADTSRLLRMLSEERVRATFFVVGGDVAAEPSILLRQVLGGHEVANHSWGHPLLPSLGDDAIRSELRRTRELVTKVSGARMQLMRPPYGGLDARVISAISDPIILWSVDPLDWLNRNADTVHGRVVTQTRPGSIVLLHDIHPTTVDAVPRIIRSLKDKGYTFVTVSELYGGTLTPGTVYTGREDDWIAAHAKGSARTKPDVPAPDGIPQLHEGPRPGDSDSLSPVTEPAPAPATSGPRPLP